TVRSRGKACGGRSQLQPPCGPGFGFVVRMLERDDRLLSRIVAGVVMNRCFEYLFHPRQPRGMVDLYLRREIGTVVEGSDGDLEPARMAIGQRRAAAGAEAAVDVDRRLEITGLLARPFDAVLRHRHQRREERAELLLAHAAMADRRPAELAVDAEAHRAALAPARSHFVVHRLSSGGQVSVS